MKAKTKKSEAKVKPGNARAQTRQRQVVLDVVQSGDTHPTAAEIFEAARRKMPGISFATVYNSLRFLKEAGLVREVAFGNGPSRYDPDTERHHHTICSPSRTLTHSTLPAPVAFI